MQPPIRFFLSYDNADVETVEDVYKHLVRAFPDRELVFWENAETPPEKYRSEAARYLQTTDVFVAVFSVDYENTPDVRWEIGQALLEYEQRPDLIFLLVQARHAPVPPRLRGFPVAPSASEAIENDHITRDRQLQRMAEMARQIMLYQPAVPEPEAYAQTGFFKFEDIRERLYTFLGRHNLIEVIHFLRAIIHPDRMPDVVYAIEDAYTEIQQQNAGNKLGFQEYLEKLDALRIDLNTVLEQLEQKQLRANWSHIFEAEYFALEAMDRSSGEILKSLFNPVDDIVLPESLNLANAGDGEVGLLSTQQQQDFRRNLLLCQDAFVVRNHARAFSLCDQVRTQIDPQSAQLYEYMLAAFTYKESPDRIVNDLIEGNGRLFNHITLFASRFEEYQRALKCVSTTGYYNSQAVAEEIADALSRHYSRYPDDYMLDTGHYATRPASHREAIKICLETAARLFRSVSPYQGFLKVAINELCGGGKLHWVRGIKLYQDEIRFVPVTDIDVESQVLELILLLEKEEQNELAAQTARYKYWKPQQIRDELRENLFLRLKAKRQDLEQRIAAEERRYKHLTDLRESAIRFVHACLLGYKVYGDRNAPEGESFLRLAIEQLLPNLLVAPDNTSPLPLRWFELDAEGDICMHAECIRYNFDPLMLVKKIIRDHAGTAGWLKAQPNIKRETFLEFAADTEMRYEQVKKGLSFTDIRRMNDIDARTAIIDCLHRWMICYKAYPETGQPFLRKIMLELTGNGLMEWMYFNPLQFAPHPDSEALGYHAVEEFAALLDLPTGFSQEEAYQTLAENLYRRRILPAYENLRPFDESRRSLAVSLIIQLLHLYRDLHPAPEYLDLIWQEITEERKFRWIDIGVDGIWTPWEPMAIDPRDILVQLAKTSPDRFQLLDARRQIATRRYRDHLARYERETRENRADNGRVERGLVIDVIRRMEGIYDFLPELPFLELPLLELEYDKGRIRWYALFLGLFRTMGNHHENHLFNFDFRSERVFLRDRINRRYELMEKVIQSL